MGNKTDMKGKTHEQQKDTLEIAPGSCRRLVGLWTPPLRAAQPRRGSSRALPPGSPACQDTARTYAFDCPPSLPLATPWASVERSKGVSELRWGTSIIPPGSASAELVAPGGDAARPASAMPTCPWVLPTVQLALLLAVEAVEVAPAAAVDEGPAFGDSLVVVPPQCVVLAVPLVQRQAAGLSCGVQMAMVRAGRSRQLTSDGGSWTHLAEEEKPQKGKAVDGSQLSTGRVWLEGTSLPCPSARSESRRCWSGQALLQGQLPAKAGGRARRQVAQGHDGHSVPWKATSRTLCMLLLPPGLPCSPGGFVILSCSS